MMPENYPPSLHRQNTTSHNRGCLCHADCDSTMTQSGHSRKPLQFRKITILRCVVENAVAQPDPAFGVVGSAGGLQQ
jgi:hypothetical protein